jgi:hypothetical protein
MELTPRIEYGRGCPSPVVIPVLKCTIEQHNLNGRVLTPLACGTNDFGPRFTIFRG